MFQKIFYRFYLSNYKNQIIAAIFVNFMTFSHGLALGWLSPALPILQSDNCPLDSGKVTLEQISWLASLTSLGSMIGNILFGCIIDKIGRKITLLLVGVPNTCFWLIVIFGKHIDHLLIGRLLGGLTGGGLFVAIPLFIAEISDSRIRGALSSMLLLFLNCGILGGYILGSHLTYKLVPLTTVWISLLCMVIILFFPDTPQYLLKLNQENKAEISLKFYRNYLGRSKEELNKFNDYFTSLKEIIFENQISHRKKIITIKDFCTIKSAKGLTIGIVLMALNMFSGTYAITNYSSKIFSESGSLLDPNMNTIIFGTIQILGTCVAITLVDRFGRRPLLLISSIGVTLGLMTVATYSYLRESVNLDYLHWIPTVTLSFVIFIASIGIIPLPLVVLAEVLPNNIRTLGSTICVCALSIMAFTLLKMFPILMLKMNLYGVMWLCGSITAIGVLFIVIFVPETKGKVLDTIETNSFNNSNVIESTDL